MLVSEADQLFATQVAYSDFDQVIKALGRPVTLGEAIAEGRKLSISMGSMDKYLDSSGQLKPEYSHANEWIIRSAVNENTVDGTGLYACIIDTGEANILACRGSESMGDMLNWKQDWYEADLKLLNSEMTKQEAALADYMLSNKACLNSKPWVATGHSLGGGLADFAAVKSVDFGMDNFSGAINFDGPGHSQEFLKKYRAQIEAINEKLIHKKASIVGNLLFDLPGSKIEYVKTASESQFLDENGNPLKQTTDIGVLAQHDTQNWVRNEDGSLAEGEPDWYETFIAEKLSRMLDRLPSFIGNSLPEIVNLVFVGANKLTKYMKKHPNVVKMIATAVSAFLLRSPGTIYVAIGVAASVVAAVAAFVVILIVGELLIEAIESILEAVAQAVSVAVEWLKGKALELFEAAKEAFLQIKEWFRANSPGGRNADTCPYFRANVTAMRDLAERINRVNRRTAILDIKMDDLYLQVRLLDMAQIFKANVLTDWSLRLKAAENYLRDAANRIAEADRNAYRCLEGDE